MDCPVWHSGLSLAARTLLALLKFRASQSQHGEAGTTMVPKSANRLFFGLLDECICDISLTGPTPNGPEREHPVAAKSNFLVNGSKKNLAVNIP
jgi:hypothetical protein